MTKLVWDQNGERRYENGTDRGVLYVANVNGVPWNGLISVNESTVGGEVSSYYLDGVKYMDYPSGEDYRATVEAFTYPDEFAQCDGTLSVHTGLLATRQMRSRFGLSYRTKIGNDVDGSDHAYKIHLVYNAIATPSDKNYGTEGENTSITNFSWTIDAIPVELEGYTPTAHFIVDSRTTNQFLLEELEDILYGDDVNAPRLPTPEELLEIYELFSPLITIMDNGDGTWTAIGPDDLITMTNSTTFQITGAAATYIDTDTYTITSN